MYVCAGACICLDLSGSLFMHGLQNYFDIVVALEEEKCNFEHF